MTDNILSEIVARYTAGLLEAELHCNWRVMAEVVPARIQVTVAVDGLELSERQRLFRVHSDIVCEALGWNADFVLEEGQ